MPLQRFLFYKYHYFLPPNKVNSLIFYSITNLYICNAGLQISDQSKGAKTKMLHTICHEEKKCKTIKMSNKSPTSDWVQKKG